MKYIKSDTSNHVDLNAHQKYAVPWFYLRYHDKENNFPWILRDKFSLEEFP